MHDGFLDKARRKFRKGEFAEVIRLLEGTIFNYRDNHAFFYLLGMSCVRRGVVAGAQSYLQRAAQLEPENLDVKSALAAISLKQSMVTDSIKIWLDILETNPGHTLAKRGLETVRRADTPEELRKFLESSRFYKLVPDNNPHRTLSLLAAIAGILLLSFAVVAGTI